MTSQQPYLSVVAASRNDDHGKNLRRRMQIFVNGFFEQCHRFQVPAELIMIDWNPPPEKPPLAEALSWPVQDAFCSARIIQVPPAIHQKYKHSEALPLFQMIAKNVGIRRAKGEFILATNIDILLNDALMQFIAERRLRHGVVYRINRYDVAEDVPLDATIQEQLAYCENNLIRVNTKGFILAINRKKKFVYKPLITERLSIIMPNHVKNIYIILYKSLFGKPRQSDNERAVVPNSPPIMSEIKNPSAPVNPFRKRWRRIYKSLRQLDMMVKMPHLNACGDFTLMARTHWVALQGYPEYEMYSMHIDSLLLFAAWSGGIREHILNDPMRIYHIEHSSGSGWTPEGVNTLNQRLQDAGIPQLSYEDLLAKFEKMRMNRKLTVFNSATWGIADQLLPELVKFGNIIIT